jgi:hypothetical protein
LQRYHNFDLRNTNWEIRNLKCEMGSEKWEIRNLKCEIINTIYDWDLEFGSSTSSD